jgi:hypothetical protein
MLMIRGRVELVCFCYPAPKIDKYANGKHTKLIKNTNGFSHKGPPSACLTKSTLRPQRIFYEMGCDDKGFIVFLSSKKVYVSSVSNQYQPISESGLVVKILFNTA